MKDTLNLSLKLMLVCGVAALLLSQVAAFTSEPIRLAMLKAKMEAVAAVLPAYDNAPDADKVSLPAGDERLDYYRGFRGDQLSGVAVKAITDMGYSGEIELMLGVDAEGRVSGVRIVRHAETPGLGAKYADAALLDAYYKGKSLTDTDWRVTKDGGDLDAVTGATITGRALGNAIDTALRRYETEREQVLGAPRAEPDSLDSPGSPDSNEAEGLR